MTKPLVDRVSSEDFGLSEFGCILLAGIILVCLEGKKREEEEEDKGICGGKCSFVLCFSLPSSLKICHVFAYGS